ncbi:arsenate reductase (glutaredoxin) [Flavobacterium urocaniciphilum]|uniref:Arsenate reductase n=1 Tax=Flavobacterium urocaniciphilum TaxID=1299341 RepID=A0A1H8Z7E0_9FLAO|nr:arsenate reductase (glutaredoxin) [Flavobacterium urocaniciphilum]SEP60375.1 arsenate reductase [Flavobacterium urocaniciphilum]
MITILHNNRCSKSREGLCFIEALNQPFEIINYLDKVPTYSELESIIKKLNIKPIELVRIKEKDWTENFKGKNLSDKEIIEAMINFPKLIERPIVINGNKAVIARPTEKINDIL